MPSSPNDSRLLKLLRNGHPEALGVVYQKYRADMLAVALSMASDRAVAEDAVHDVFVSFAGVAHSLEIRRSLKSYLLTSIVNRIRNIYKAGSRAAASVAAEGSENHQSLWPDPPSTATLDLSRLQRALDALPEAQRCVIILHLLEGIRFRAIAESQGESLHTVQSRYRYGMQKMRSFLDEGNEHV